MSRPAEVIDTVDTLHSRFVRHARPFEKWSDLYIGGASLLAAFADDFAMATRWRGACRGEETMSINQFKIIQLATTAAPLHGTHKDR